MIACAALSRACCAAGGLEPAQPQHQKASQLDHERTSSGQWPGLPANAFRACLTHAAPVLCPARPSGHQADVRRKVLEYAPALLEACGNNSARQVAVVRAAVGRLFDVEESVRRAAVAAVGALLQSQPALASSAHTEGRGSVLNCLMMRLRDKKLAVRREAASQLAALMRAWVVVAAESPAHAPPAATILSIPLVLCSLGVRHPDLGAYVFDQVFRAGIFPSKLPPAEVARWWAAMWKQAGKQRLRVTPAGGEAALLLCRLLFSTFPGLDPPELAASPPPYSVVASLLPACVLLSASLATTPAWINPCLSCVPLQERRGGPCWARS